VHQEHQVRVIQVELLLPILLVQVVVVQVQLVETCQQVHIMAVLVDLELQVV
tara:strand:- start:167 stop:322 length:156 start_codon:yes stop_codon:yes gene_type:complete